MDLKVYNFTKENDEWYFEEYFEVVTEFRDSSSNRKGYVSFLVEDYDYDDKFRMEKPQNYQEKAFNYFVENKERILNSLCEGIIEYYPKMLQKYNLENIYEFKSLELKTVADVKQAISIDFINILGQSKENVGYLGFSGDCPWDPEHGFGVVMHKDRVIKVEDADLASSNLYVIYEDKMTKEEWKAFKQKMEDEKNKNYPQHEEEMVESNPIHLNEIEVDENNYNYQPNTEEIKLNQIDRNNLESNNIKPVKMSKKKWWHFWRK